jgi:hypothetical protein
MSIDCHAACICLEAQTVKCWRQNVLTHTSALILTALTSPPSAGSGNGVAPTTSPVQPGTAAAVVPGGVRGSGGPDRLSCGTVLLAATTLFSTLVATYMYR